MSENKSENIREPEVVSEGKFKTRWLKLAADFGMIEPGWDVLDYFIHAIDNEGYETGAIHGAQGSGKSSRMLQYGGGMAYHHLLQENGYEPNESELWDFVLKHVIFKPAQFVERLEAVPRGTRLPFVLWDDIGVHYTSSTFKTDIKQYAAVDATWAAIRTKVAVVMVTIPVLNRLAKNVKDNLTFEIYLGRNQMEQVRRLFYLPGTKHLDSNLFRPILKRHQRFNLYDIPEWVWDEYWEMRLDLTEEALSTLKGVTDMEDTENFTKVWELAKDLSISANTIQQMGSRKLIPTQVINGELCIPNEFIPELKEEYG